MMHYFISFITALALLISGSISHAKDFSIAAVVNNTLISNLDVEERVKLVLATTGLPATDETQAKLRSQILSSMIDEALKIQEAKSFNYSVSSEERKNALDILNKQKKAAHPEGILEMLKEKAVGEDTFTQQLEGEILWNKVIRDRITRNVSVTEEEISRAQNQIINSVQEEVNIASLILPVTTPEEEPRVEQLAKSISADVTDAQGFAAVARQLGSQGMRSIRPQWVPVGRLDPIYKRSIAPLKPGEVSQPARTPNGYEILLYNGTRERSAGGDSELYLKQVVLPLESTAPKETVEEMISIAKTITQNPGDCFNPTVAGIEDTASLGISIEFLRTKLSKLSPQIRGLVSGLKVSKISKPFPTPAGIQMLMICERIDLPPELPDAQKVRQVLFDEKLALETQKYLRNLRRSAFIEKRDS